MSIPNEAIEAAADAMQQYAITEDRDGYAKAAVEAAAPFLRAQALEDAADAITWVKPEKSPCESFEACCGSEASCDAMRPSAYAVGGDWLRARAVTERGQG